MNSMCNILLNFMQPKKNMCNILLPYVKFPDTAINVDLGASSQIG